MNHANDDERHERTLRFVGFGRRMVEASIAIGHGERGIAVSAMEAPGAEAAVRATVMACSALVTTQPWLSR